MEAAAMEAAVEAEVAAAMEAAVEAEVAVALLIQSRLHPGSTQAGAGRQPLQAP
jgi:hypothetical protein